jgi:hypothetical protein
MMARIYPTASPIAKGHLMKVTFDIDCTPEEARMFLGLPNVAGMQDRLMKDMESKILENFNALDPETLVKTWMPMSIQGWSEMQKMFWDHMMNTANTATPPAAEKKAK